MSKRSASYRSLQHGEAVPHGQARRYSDTYGYTILRWKVAPYTYVEAKEHRFVMGMPPDSMDVHHVNGIKDDNRPDNLRVLPSQEHNAIHIFPSWDVDQAMSDYRNGLSFPAIGRKYGIHAVTAMRAMKLRGLVSRPAPKDATHCANGHTFTERDWYEWRGKRMRKCRPCQAARQRAYKAKKAGVHTEPINYISETRAE